MGWQLGHFYKDPLLSRSQNCPPARQEARKLVHQLWPHPENEAVPECNTHSALVASETLGDRRQSALEVGPVIEQ